MKWFSSAILSLVLHAGLQAGPANTEPTNAPEAAAKKAAAEAAVAAKYEAWVATLTPERQVWEKVLRENLGSFYLPIHRRTQYHRRGGDEAKGVAVNDLFTAVTPHVAEYRLPEDVHYNAAGYDFLAAKVAEVIASNLERRVER